MHRSNNNYNWARTIFVVALVVGLGWMSSPVMAHGTEVCLADGDTTVHVVADVQPEFNGNLNQWLGENIMYPEEAQQERIEGKVFVTFTVEKDGAISHVTVVRSAHPILDAEAVRVIQSMPKWKPAMMNGEAVRFSKTLPITFKLAEEQLTYEQYLKNLEEEQELLKQGNQLTPEVQAARVEAFKKQLGDDATLYKLLLEKSQAIKGEIDSVVKAQSKVLKLKKTDVKELTKIYENEIDAKIKLIESLGTDDFVNKFVSSEIKMRQLEMDKMLQIKDLLKDRFKLYFENYILLQ